MAARHSTKRRHGKSGLPMEDEGQVTKFIDHAKRCGLALSAFATAVAIPAIALAQPQDWQVGFQEPASPIMRQIDSFNNGLLILITIIALFVVGLLAIVMIRFRAKANPVPSKTTHNTVIEVLWTIIPVLILVGIAIPSFGLLFDQYDPGRVIEDYNPDEALNVKVTAQRFNWMYEYLDNDGIRFVSNLDIDTEPRLLRTTMPMVVPVDTVVRLTVTAQPNDVLHAFSINAMGVKTDAVPGRIMESWFLADREGTFYGQCSELCGALHYAMPIELRVVSQEQFQEWTEVAADDLGAAKELLDTWEAERIAQVAAR
jgi:cytochrome c oxidase subunit 2